MGDCDSVELIQPTEAIIYLSYGWDIADEDSQKTVSSLIYMKSERSN